MKGFILCAGLGTRLKPWTENHPKALFPIEGVPMLERVVEKMLGSGITDITVNVHHFADQIVNFIKDKGWKNIHISDETGELLETGGAILHAQKFLGANSEPILVHNVDILSNADFKQLAEEHSKSQRDATLLVSERNSSRRLVFNDEMRLAGWHSIATGEYRPENFNPENHKIVSYHEYPFSGIYIINPQLIEKMKRGGWKGKFSIMDFFLATLHENIYKGYYKSDLWLEDIGKAK